MYLLLNLWCIYFYHVFLQLRKEKAVYDTLNMLNFDVTKKCLVGEGWCPSSAEPQVGYLTLLILLLFFEHNEDQHHFALLYGILIDTDQKCTSVFWFKRFRRRYNVRQIIAIRKWGQYFMWWMPWNHHQHISEPTASQMHFKRLLMHTGLSFLLRLAPHCFFMIVLLLLGVIKHRKFIQCVLETIEHH